MNDLLSGIQIKVNDRLFLKDPVTSDLGMKILKGSVHLIHKLGFEHFNFQKLAKEIHSTEASVYRYFESKQKLLLYLINWYWAWMEYRMVMEISSLTTPKKKLERILAMLCESLEAFKSPLFDLSKLQMIVEEESTKSYLNKEVDQVNKDGAYLNFKKIVSRIADEIKSVNASYKFPNMMASSIIEGIHQQKFFAKHLPRLTNQDKGEDFIFRFYKELLFKTIEK